uniref:Uncharacterized protein n=1 Tax=Polytomella parva TaxID=51329 RepID=A0A7S0UXB1_9CHLO
MSNSGLIKGKEGNKERSVTFGELCAVALLTSISLIFYFSFEEIHKLEKHHHSLIFMMPFLAIAWIVFVIPLFMYMSYLDDFKRLNPIIPTHYIRIATRCYKALSKNNLKVREKDM